MTLINIYLPQFYGILCFHVMDRHEFVSGVFFLITRTTKKVQENMLSLSENMFKFFNFLSKLYENVLTYIIKTNFTVMAS